MKDRPDPFDTRSPYQQESPNYWWYAIISVGLLFAAFLYATQAAPIPIGDGVVMMRHEKVNDKRYTEDDQGYESIVSTVIGDISVSRDLVNKNKDHRPVTVYVWITDPVTGESPDDKPAPITLQPNEKWPVIFRAGWKTEIMAQVR